MTSSAATAAATAMPLWITGIGARSLGIGINPTAESSSNPITHCHNSGDSDTLLDTIQEGHEEIHDGPVMANSMEALTIAFNRFNTDMDPLHSQDLDSATASAAVTATAEVGHQQRSTLRVAKNIWGQKFGMEHSDWTPNPAQYKAIRERVKAHTREAKKARLAHKKCTKASGARKVNRNLPSNGMFANVKSRHLVRRQTRQEKLQMPAHVRMAQRGRRMKIRDTARSRQRPEIDPASGEVTQVVDERYGYRHLDWFESEKLALARIARFPQVQEHIGKMVAFDVVDKTIKLASPTFSHSIDLGDMSLVDQAKIRAQTISFIDYLWAIGIKYKFHPGRLEIRGSPKHAGWMAFFCTTGLGRVLPEEKDGRFSHGRLEKGMVWAAERDWEMQQVEDYFDRMGMDAPAFTLKAVDLNEHIAAMQLQATWLLNKAKEAKKPSELPQDLFTRMAAVTLGDGDEAMGDI